jgi:flagellar basal body-associated protein FliL
MTTQRWLQLATALTALLLVVMIAVAWHSAVEERRRADDIPARARETMERIEARANALENAAGR